MDRTEPDTSTVSCPSDTTSATVTITFDGSDAQTSVVGFECMLLCDPEFDGTFSAEATCTVPTGAFNTWTPCSTPQEVTLAFDTRAIFLIRAVDSAGNKDSTPASCAWTRDNTPPETFFTLIPPAVTDSSSLEFQFDATDPHTPVVEFECRIDAGGTFAPCSSPLVFSASPGLHFVQVRAKNSAGVVDPTPALYVFRVSDSASAESRVASLGSAHTCATDSYSVAWCWGSNVSGQLGDGTGIDSNVPVQVSTTGVTQWVDVSGGSAHTCAIKANGTLWCWGDNSSGQLGLGVAGGVQLLPQQVGTGTDWVKVEVGGNFSCALTAGGELYCWGNNSSGQLGQGDTTARTSPTLVTDFVIDFSAGPNWVCAVRAGYQEMLTLWCWGDNTYAQLTTEVVVPGPILTPQWVATSFKNVKTVKAGSGHACLLTSTDELYCWGRNDFGQVGVGSFASPVDYPQRVIAVTSTDKFMSVGTYNLHTCAVRSADQTLWCWGDNTYGQLGIGVVGGAFDSPQQEFYGLTNWVSVAEGEGADHSCARDSAGDLWCWGANTSGQVGDGTTIDADVPQNILSW